MATATATPDVEPVVVVEPTWSQRFRAWFKRKTQAAGMHLAKAGENIKNAGIKAASWTGHQAKRAWKGLVRGTTTVLFVVGLAAKGSAFYLMRGLGYVVYGLAWLIEKILTGALTILAAVLFVAVALVLFVIIAIGALIRQWRLKVVGFFKWVANGGTRQALKPYVTEVPAQAIIHGDSYPTNVRRQIVDSIRGFSQMILDDRVDVDDFAIQQEDAITKVRRYTEGDFDPMEKAIVPEWAKLDNPILDNYQGLLAEDILDRHQQHTMWLGEEGIYKTRWSYWQGRTYALSQFLHAGGNEENLKTLEEYYQAWKNTTQTAPKRTFDRQKVREGIKDEIRILKGRLGEGSLGSEWRAEQEAATAAASS